MANFRELIADATRRAHEADANWSRDPTPSPLSVTIRANGKLGEHRDRYDFVPSKAAAKLDAERRAQEAATAQERERRELEQVEQLATPWGTW